MGESTELKPCPFCGSSAIGLSWNGQPAREVFLRCPDCGACGPAKTEASDAVVTAWNTRSEGLQPPVGEVEGEVFSSLGASKAPSCGSPTVPETPSDGWQEVETAPRISREPFLAWDGDCQFAAYWNSGEWYGYGLVGVVNFTHWRPLPAPPTDCQTSGGEA